MALVPANQIAVEGGFNSTAVALLLPSSVQAGSVIYVVSNYAIGGTLTLPTDSQSNTYTLIDTCNNGAGDQVTAQYWTTTSSAGPLTVTVNGTGVNDHLNGCAVEIIGASTLAGHNSLNSNPGTGANAVVSGTASITAALPAVIIGFNLDCNGSAVGGAGSSPIAFTGLTSVWSGTALLEYAALPSTPSTVQATAADTSFTHHNMMMAVFAGSPPPTITAQPTSSIVPLGSTATMSVTAAAAVGPLTYRWQSNTGSGMGNISGATSASYTTPSLAYSDNATTYQCVITDTGNSTTSTTNVVRVIVDFNTTGSALLRYFATFGSGPWGSGAFGAFVTGKASGGSTYNLSVPESIAAADAPSNILTTNPAIAQSMAATDAPSAQASDAASVAETAAAADAPSAAAVTATAISESVTGADTPSAASVKAVAAAETMAGADAPSAIGILAGAVAETSASIDALSAVMTTTQAVSESAGVADAAAAAATTAVAATESIAGADAPSGALVSGQAIAEAGAATDAPDASLTTPQAISETTIAGDAPSASASSPQAVAEGVAAADQPSTNAQVAGSISEAATGADSMAAVIVTVQSIAEVVGAADTAAASAILAALIAELSAAADMVNGIAVLGVSLAEALAASDLVNQASGTLLGVSEATSTSDVADGVRVISALIANSLAATDATGASAVIVAQALESMSPLDILDATRVLAAALSELAQSADAPSASGTMFSLGVGESLASIDAAAWLAIAHSLLRTFMFPVYAREYRFAAYARVALFPPYPRAFRFPAYPRTFNFTTD